MEAFVIVLPILAIMLVVKVIIDDNRRLKYEEEMRNKCKNNWNYCWKEE